MKEITYLNNNKKKGKLYKYDILQFEGEFMNDKKWNGKGYDAKGNKTYELKNGKGKIWEYYKNGNKEFEGDYLNGERNGKGKEYYENGKLKFEGKYSYGKRRTGKEYYENGKLEFEGEYFHNERLRGKEYDLDGKIREIKECSSCHGYYKKLQNSRSDEKK